MIEFIKKEVWCMEETEVSRASLLNFFLNGHREDMVVLLKGNIFHQYTTYEGLLYNIPGNDCSVRAGENVFREAAAFFAEKTNRLRLLPVVDGRGSLLSFLRWNNQKREVGKPDQELEEIEKASSLYLRECSESIYLWLQAYLQEHTGKEIILEGEGWEVLTACQAVPSGNNKVTLNTRRGVCGALEITFGKIPRVGANSIKSIWTLKEKYLGCRIFVWLDNKQGVDICTRLIFSGIHLDGFCVESNKELLSFLGKPVIELSVLAGQPDVLIVYWDEEAGRDLKDKISQMQALCLRYHGLFELRKEIYQKENVIYYSSRKRAERVTELLEEHHAEVRSYAPVGEGKNNDKWRGKSVDIDRILEASEKYNLILASSTYFFERDIQGLPNVNIDIYVPSKDVLYTSAPVIFDGNLGFFLDKPIKEGKKMKLYGMHSCFTNAWLYFFHDLNIKAEKMVDNVVVDDGGTQSVYDLPYENTADTYVIINKELGEWVKSCELVESLGFTHINENYAGLYQVGQRNLLEKKDVTLGYVTETLVDNGKYPGFQVYGEEQENDLRIVTLGGSTTAAELFRVKCWPEILYRQFLEAGRNVTIYNGGVAAYTAGEELFKLIRDVGELRPDIVISFSGLNNIKKNEYPFVSWYLKDIFEAVFKGDFCKGIKNGHMSTAQIWVRQEQMMRAICSEVYGAEFICFPQPVYASKEHLTLAERLRFETDSEYRENALEFRKEASQLAKPFPWMIDIQSLLDDKPEIFMDSAHVYEAGNRIIADIIYRKIGIQAGLKGKAAKYSNLERK